MEYLDHPTKVSAFNETAVEHHTHSSSMENTTLDVTFNNQSFISNEEGKDRFTMRYVTMSTHLVQQMMKMHGIIYYKLVYMMERVVTPLILIWGTISNALVCVVLLGRDMSPQDLSMVFLAGNF